MTPAVVTPAARTSTAAPAWCEKYMQIPFVEKGRSFDGCDCWGLAVLVCRNEFGIELPDYADAYDSTDNRFAIAAKIEAEKRAGIYEPVYFAEAGTIIILRLQGRPWHCAIAVDKRWMLHIVRGANAVLELTHSWVWRNHVEGMYRHV